MKDPSLDVIIPVKDAGPFLGQAILSILSQSLLPSRIIVIDDGSIDDTGKIVARFGKKITLVTGPSKGPSAARNWGVLNSEAEFVTFLDADDLYRADRISMFLDAIGKNRDAAIAFCDVEYLSEHGKETGTVVNFPEFRQEAFFGQLLERNRIATTSAVMIRKAAFLDAGGFDEDFLLGEDYDLWLRLAQRHKFVHISVPLVLYRLHSGNISRDTAGHQRSEINALKKHSAKTIRTALDELHVSPKRALLSLSQVLFRREDYKVGMALLESLIPDPNDTFLYKFVFGNFRLKTGDENGAEKYFMQCLEMNPVFAPALNNLGALTAKRSKIEAEKLFREAILQRPDYNDPASNLVILKNGKMEKIRFTFSVLRTVLKPAT